MPIHDQRSEGDRAMGQAQQKHRAVLIVEDDAELRSLTAALLEDEEIDTIECESAEAALAVMLIGGQHVALIFADIRLRGVMGCAGRCFPLFSPRGIRSTSICANSRPVSLTYPSLGSRSICSSPPKRR
jgi:hypothetical protein